MPELPEVETVRRDVSEAFVGHRLQQVLVTGRRTVRRHLPGQLASLEGMALDRVDRHGKYLLFRWLGGPVMVAHLRMSGQLLAVRRGAPVAPHTHAVLSFAGRRELRFVDPRTFGELFLSGPAVPELAHLGPDALAATPGDLAAALARRRAPVKALLVDQRALAGIGNIYADEICWEAKLRPDRQAGTLSRREVNRLHAAVQVVLRAAIEARGSTLGDQQYRDLYGATGGYQSQHRAYGRAGEPCARCGRAVQRLRIGAKSAYLCAYCQR